MNASHEDGRYRIVFDDGGMNLLSISALEEIDRILDSVPSSARVLTFESGRERLFAAGADMNEMSGFDAEEALGFAEKGQRLFSRLERLPFPTIALIDGDCFGGALDLTLAFDLRWATPRSSFSHPGARIGIVTGFGGTSRWRRVLSPQAARQLFLGSEVWTADRALESGLIDRMIPSTQSSTGGLREEIDRVGTLQGRSFQMVKELAAASMAIPADELLLLGRRLGSLYAGQGSGVR